MDRPQIILVHGAHHSPYHLETLATRLRSPPYLYHVRVPHLPSTKADPPARAFEADVATIKSAMEEAAAEGNSKIFPVFHSYASVPGFDAIASLSAEARARVIRAMLIAAFVLEKGNSPTTVSQGQVAPWAEKKVRGQSGSGCEHLLSWLTRMIQDELVFVTNPAPTFYSDLPESLAEEYAAHVSSQAYSSICTPTLYEGWRDIPITYLLCKNDNAVHPDWIQRPTVALLQKCGWKEELKVIEIESSHSPFLSHTDLCARIIAEDVLASADNVTRG